MENNTVWYKNKLVLGAIVVVIIIAIAMFARGGTSDNTGDNGGGGRVVDDSPLEGEIAVLGKLGCMPLKSGDTPSADECIIGLAGDDGKFYALDTSKVEAVEKGISVDTDVRVIGAYTPVDSNSGEVGIYKYDGVLVTRLMQNQD